MANVKIDFTGNADQAQREFDKLIRSQAKMREQLRLIREESAKGVTEAGKFTNAWETGLSKIKASNDRWAAGMKNLEASSAPFRRSMKVMAVDMAQYRTANVAATVSLSGLVGGLTQVAGPMAAVTAGVAFAKRAYADWSAEVDRLAASHRSFSESLARDLSESGRAAEGGKIQKALSSIPGATAEQGRQAFRGAVQAAPTEGTDRLLEITSAVARLAPTGQDLGQAGNLAGNLAGIFPKASGADVADVGQILTQRAGGDISKLGGDSFLRNIKALTSAGISPERALGMGLATADAKMKPDILGRVAEVVAASPQELAPSLRRGQRPTAEQAAMLQLSRMGGAERLAALQGGGDVARAALGDEGAFKFSQLSADQIAAGTSAVKGAFTSDVIGQSVKDLGASRAGQVATARQQIAAQRGQREAALARRSESLEILDEMTRNRAAGGGLAGRAFAEASIGLRRFAVGFGGAGDTPEKIAAQNEGLDALIQIMAKNAAATENLARQRGAQNIDAHTE